MNIPTNTVLKTLDNKTLKLSETEDLTLGKALSEVLVANTDGGKMKMFTLAQKAYTDKSLDVDDADLALIKATVETSKIYNNLILGQILVMLEDVKEAKKDETKK